MLIFAYFLFSGILAGVLGGLLGIGGGLVFIPAQLAVFQLLKVPAEIQMHFALGTSLSAVVINTVASSIAHHKRNSIHTSIVKKIFIGVICGAILGALLAKHIPSKSLELIFGTFQLLFGVYFLASPPVREHTEIKDFNTFILNILIAFTSAFSVILGIGGGIFLVPILTFLNLPLRLSIGSASAITLIVSLTGALTMLVSSWDVSALNYSIGYIFLPAFLPLSMGSLIGAPLGVKLTHSISTKFLKPTFGIIIIVLGISILLK
jgi:uncharacterized membrane protein YfcA